MPTTLTELSQVTNSRDIVFLRRELAQAELQLRERAELQAVRLAWSESFAWRQAQADCFYFDHIRNLVEPRLRAIIRGSPQKFPGEQELAELALHNANQTDAAYTIISFARLHERLRYLRGGAEREAVIGEALKRRGVYTERGYFQEILK